MAACLCRVWWERPWNLAEGFLALGSLITIFPGESSGRLITGRPFRFMRGFRLVRCVGGLAAISSTLWLSLPSMAAIIALLAISNFIYASTCGLMLGLLAICNFIYASACGLMPGHACQARNSLHMPAGLQASQVLLHGLEI